MKTVTLKQSEDLVLELPEGFAEPGEKVSITEQDGAIIVSKMVPIEVDLDDETFLKIAKLAHEKDLTFNEMCCNILEEQLKELENPKSKLSNLTKTLVEEGVYDSEEEEKPYDSEMY